MVVTGSRLHAVRYYQEFQRYIKKMGYENELGILIAFSGTVHDGGEEYTEVSLNGIKESELPGKIPQRRVSGAFGCGKIPNWV